MELTQRPARRPGDTQQRLEFAAWDKNQQATTLASYRSGPSVLTRTGRADAELFGEHSNQLRGERRRRMFSSSGTTADAESSLLVSAATFGKEHCGLTFSNVESDLITLVRVTTLIMLVVPRLINHVKAVRLFSSTTIALFLAAETSPHDLAQFGDLEI